MLTLMTAYPAISAGRNRALCSTSSSSAKCLPLRFVLDQTDENRLEAGSGFCSTDQPDFSSVWSTKVKRHLGGKYFANDDDVQHEVLLWMGQ
ncbi:hypothetical protein AVEN_212508-1 [Araneus ventricosus]|uniref:Uncharacterized protein n=1 Tax=Araneus ventricosus TaxID=182803 RepID=A0A4Y2K9W8_ARAVE|nr:hypothetical protein AVEN_212508-1 [Araneus ventricosus]